MLKRVKGVIIAATVGVRDCAQREALHYVQWRSSKMWLTPQYAPWQAVFHQVTGAARVGLKI
jgi:hypothetical protein